MVTLDQVKLLDEKVTRAIDYVKRVTGENGRLTEENSRLTEKLGSCQKRIDELEVLVLTFKEEQGRIEDGILSALDRLNQFEDAVEGALAAAKAAPEKKAAAPKGEQAAKPAVPRPETAKEDPAADTDDAGEGVGDEPPPDNGELDIF
jgi:peptidoglycan hydrolase CwlO-like protein